jgi:hypothetical protein
MITLASLTICILLGSICLYQFAFKDHGPLSLCSERFVQARTHLHEADDACQKPLGLLALCTLVLILALDGWFTGFALTTSAFAQWLSPRGAQGAAVLWSLGCTYLLYKLIVLAAREAVVNERRAAIRTLSGGDAEQQERAAAMKKRVGAALGHDYSLSANRYSARVALLVTVLVLVGATFTMRTAGEASAAPGDAGAAQPPTQTMTAPMPTAPLQQPAGLEV